MKRPLLIFTAALAGSLCAFAERNHRRMAGAIVTSREWHVKRGKNTVEEFSGDVHYRGGAREVFADRAVFDHASQNWTASGHVRASRRLDSGEVWAAEGDEAEYDETSMKGRLRAMGQVRLLRRANAGPPDHALADRLDWTGERRILLSGRARSWGPRLDFWADQALIVDASGPAAGCAARHVELTGGRPVALNHPQNPEDWIGAVKGDVLKSRHPRSTASEIGVDLPRCGREKFWAQGRVRGWVVFRKSSGGKSGPRKNAAAPR